MLKSTNHCIEGLESENHKHTLESEDSFAKSILQVGGYGPKSTR
jgi:hypothetical protein